jgi:hypothetical protein
MILDEETFEIDGRAFPNAYKANEYLEKKVIPIQKRIASISAECAELMKEKKELEIHLKEYYEVGKKVEGEFGRDTGISRKLRGSVGHDIDSDVHVKWLENVRRYLHD